MFWSTPVGVLDGKLYIKEGPGRNWWMLDPNTCDLLMDALSEPFVNGYSRYDGQSGHGFVDENFNYVIKFEENEF